MLKPENLEPHDWVRSLEVHVDPAVKSNKEEEKSTGRVLYILQSSRKNGTS